MTELKEIISLSIKGREDAQRALYMQHRQKWYMLCLRYGRNKSEADDILQEGLIQIFSNLHQYDHKRSAFNTWSSRVLVNAALKFLKKNSWHNTLAQIEEIYEQQDPSETIYEKLAAKELTDIVQKLPTGYRLVFNMYVIEGFTHKEIAKEIGITEGTSKSQLFKAKKMLQKQLDYHLTEYTRG